MSIDKCLLSMIIVVRNDNYTPDYLKRLMYVINFNCQNIKDLGLSDKIKIEIVDWGSKDQISNFLSVIDEDFNKIIKFIHVEKKIADKFDSYSIGNFFVELACNVGFRRSESEFLLQCPADQILSINSLQNLYNFLLKEKKRDTQKFYLLHRKILDNFFYGKNHFNFKSLNKFLDNHNFLGFKILDNRLYYGGGIGGIIVKKKDIETVKGYDENYFFRGRYGAADALITKKLLSFLDYEEMISKGVCMYKLPYSQNGKRSEQLIKNNKLFNLKNYFQFNNDFNEIKFNNKLKELNLNNKFFNKDLWGLGALNYSFNSKNLKLEKFSTLINEKDFLKKTLKLNYKNLYSIFSNWSTKEDNIISFSLLLKILNCLIKFNLISYTEIGASKINRILSISKLFPYLEMTIYFKKKINLNNDWFFLSSKICKTHKGYFKALECENNLSNNVINIQFNEQKFSNFLFLENIDGTGLQKFLLETITKSSDLIGLILIDKKLSNNIFKYLDKNFIQLEDLDGYSLMINKKLYSNELKQNYLSEKISRKKIYFTYLIIKILNMINIYNKLKYIFIKKIKK